MPPDGPPPKPARILCPGCRRWAQVDSAGVIYSLYRGLDPDSSEARIGRETARTLGAFIEEHVSCLKYSREVAFRFLHEGEPGYDALDPDMAV
jgi:hypothetical protein